MNSLLLDVRQTAALLGISERHVYELRRRGELPAPVQLGPRIVRYRRNDIEQFANRLVAARDAQEPAQLAAGKAKRAAERGEKVPA